MNRRQRSRRPAARRSQQWLARYRRRNPTIKLIAACAIVALGFVPTLAAEAIGLDGVWKSAALALSAVVVGAAIIGVASLLGGFSLNALIKEYPLRLGLMVVTIAGLGVFAFITDAQQRAVTLFEVLVDGDSERAPGAVAPSHELPFIVEHPGVEHRLLVSPYGRPAEADRATIRFELRDPDGKVQLESEATFEWVVTPGARVVRRGSWRSTGATTRVFVPEQPGRYTLLVRPITPGVPQIHVRVEDPFKRDGQRAPGF